MDPEKKKEHYNDLRSAVAPTLQNEQPETATKNERTVISLSRENSTGSMSNRENEERLHDSWLRDVLTNARSGGDDSTEAGSDQVTGGMPEPPSGTTMQPSARESSGDKKISENATSGLNKEGNEREGSGSNVVPQGHCKDGADGAIGTYEAEKQNLCKMASVYTSGADSGKQTGNQTEEGNEVAIAVARQPPAAFPDNRTPGNLKEAEATIRKSLFHGEQSNVDSADASGQLAVAELPQRRQQQREAVPGAFLSDMHGTVQAEPVRFSLLVASTSGGQLPGDEHESEHDVEAPLSGHSARDESVVQLPEPDNNSRRGSSRFLVVANPISESSHFMALAEEVGEGQKRRVLTDGDGESKRLKMKFAGIGAVVLLAGIVALVVALLTGASDEKHNTRESLADATKPPSLPVEDYVMSLLPEYTFVELKSPTSVQSAAFQWLLNDPNVTSYPAWRIQQRLALAIFYHSTNGFEWYESTNWLSYDHHECDWYSAQSIPWKLARQEFRPIEIDLEEYWDASICGEQESAGEYTQLRLYANNLHGSIPREIGWLSSLRTVLLFVNDITGTLPTEISNLGSLEILGCVACGLSGTIPTEVGLMSSLKGLGLYINPLMNGTLPSELGLLENISTVHLEECALTGTVPSELGLLTNLRTLALSYNHMVGSLPTELGLLTKLVELYAYANALTGPIPSEIGLMGALEDLEMGENMLTGTIPSEFWSLTGMAYLELHTNELEGTLPTEIGLLKELYALSIHDNKLGGQIPSEFYSLTNMWWLYLDGNSFSGTLHSSLGQLTNLRELDLSDTAMTGEVPTEIGLLTSLQYFVASNSSLSKAVPLELGSLVNLTVLDLSHNPLLSGSIPEELCRIPIVFNCSAALCGCSCSCD